jgi:glutathione S-transferase
LPHLDVYGQDHSPWVQAVLLGLYEKRVSYTITTLPPLSLFRKSGIMMPAASIDGGRWQLQSHEILQQVGYDAVSPEDMGAIYAAWGGVAHRVDSAPRFWNEFSFICDPHPSLLPRLRNHFLRSFAVLYFYLLINFMVLTRRQGDPESFADQFRYWEQKLGESKGDYLGGEEPGILDVMLFGIIQCHCSIPVPPDRCPSRRSSAHAAQNLARDHARAIRELPTPLLGTLLRTALSPAGTIVASRPECILVRLGIHAASFPNHDSADSVLRSSDPLDRAESPWISGLPRAGTHRASVKRSDERIME